MSQPSTARGPPQPDQPRNLKNAVVGEQSRRQRNTHKANQEFIT